MSDGDSFSSNASEFDVWLRMAADNKITAKNSWTVELIDYFYNLSIGRDLNFQRVAAILDGCVKIYASRVDSAVTETGSLLSGLSFQKLIQLQEPSEPENVQGSRSSRRHAVRLESTLVQSFDAIRRRAVDSELNIDPVFKRTIGLFDNGGTQSLLLNTLSVDSEGRVVFDSTTGSIDTTTADAAVVLTRIQEMLGDVSHLKICESMHALKELGANNNVIVLERREQDYISESDQEDELEDHIYDVDNALGEDIYDDVVHDNFVEVPDYELMEYFNDTLKKSAIRQDYWKVEKIISGIKEHRKYSKEPKVNTYVDFLKIDEPDFEDNVFSESESRINIPNKQHFAADFHCLPPDYHFNSERLVKLFTKDRIALKSFNKTTKLKTFPEDIAIEHTEEQEMSRLMADITREDMQELNHSYIEDFAVPTTVLHKKVQTVNFEKISRRIDIRMIKSLMSEKIQDGDKQFTSIVKDIPEEMNGTVGVYFICLLHLANEHGLHLHELNDELTIIHTLDTTL